MTMRADPRLNRRRGGRLGRVGRRERKVLWRDDRRRCLPLQDLPHAGGIVTVRGMPQAEVADLMKAAWQHMLVLGHSRLLWGRFVVHQDMQTLLRCHTAAFEAIGGVPEEVLYDRMGTVVRPGEAPEPGGVIYNATLRAFAAHYGYQPKACRAYRAKTKGKVERPFCYAREDFFLARSFHNLDDLNNQFREWLDQIANSRTHATTRRVVAEHFAEEQPKLQSRPAGPFQAVLRLERRITRDGMVSLGGNLYSVPNATRRRVVEVHSTASEVRILEDGQVIASHPVLDGRGRRRIAAGHRTLPPPPNANTPRQGAPPARSGDSVTPRSPAFCDAVGQRLATIGAQP